MEERSDTNAYYLKLCGSGGGGYILGFTKDYDKADKMLEGFRRKLSIVSNN
jgi:mevalonate kinase